MSNRTVFLIGLAGLIGGLAMALVGWVVGACYGGNFATDFNLNGLRDYEAIGQIGAVVGFATGCAIGSYPAGRLTR